MNKYIYIKVFSFILFLLYTPISMVSAQSINDIGKIVVGVKIDKKASKETWGNKDILEKRLIQYITKSGYASFDNSTFFLSPNIVIEDTEIAEGGMKNIYVVRGTLYLSIHDCMNGTVYVSMELPFKGSATKEDKAVRNAIVALNFRNASVFLEEAKNKILTFYEQQKDNIFRQADICASNGNYEEAIARLMMIPEELTDLYSQALDKAQTIYDERAERIKQEHRQQKEEANSQALVQAKNLLAMHKPQEALGYYKSGNEAQDNIYSQLLKQAEQQISADEQEAAKREERDYQDRIKREDREWEERQKEAAHKRNLENQQLASTERILHHKMDVDAQKIDAIKTVACEYIRNNPRVLYVY